MVLKNQKKLKKVIVENVKFTKDVHEYMNKVEINEEKKEKKRKEK